MDSNKKNRNNTLVDVDTPKSQNQHTVLNNNQYQQPNNQHPPPQPPPPQFISSPPRLDRSSPTETAYKKKRIVPSKSSSASKQNGGLLCAHSSTELRRVSAYCVAESLSLNPAFHHIDQLGLNPIEHKEFFYFSIKREQPAPPIQPILVLDSPIEALVPSMDLGSSLKEINTLFEGANIPSSPPQLHSASYNSPRPSDEQTLKPKSHNFWPNDSAMNDQYFDPSKHPPPSPTIDSEQPPENINIEPIMDYTKEQDNENGLVVIFEYGVVVFWDLSPSIEFRVIKMLDPFRIEPLDHKLVDDMKFEYSNSTQTSIFQDKISLDREDVYIKIAMSHSISQSVKLSSFEENLEKIIVETKQVPVHLSKEGKICLSQKRVGQLLGSLYLQKNAINLHSNLLDTPEFFWEYQQYESYHHLTEKYLEIKPRVRTLNHRLMVVRDLIDMCRSDLEARGSFRLEVIVIVLIFLELIFMILQFLHDIIV